jgi:hypothetical protein
MRFARAISIFTVVAALVAVVVLLGQRGVRRSADRPFRFEPFEEMFSCGKADVDRAKEAFLKRFPVGTPIQRIRNNFYTLGGKCYYMPKDWDDEFCIYAHMVIPLIAATGWVVIIKPAENKEMIGSIKMTVGCDSI